jgi:hypothetical protein
MLYAAVFPLIASKIVFGRARKLGAKHIWRMKKHLQLPRVVMYQHIGFLVIILICYLNELLKLPSLIFSDKPFDFVFRRSTLEMLMILAVWLLVSRSTGRLLQRIRHLESFMRVCAWCRQIDYEGEWMPMEKFVKQGFNADTTHGICPDCLGRQKSAITRFKCQQQERTNA